MERSSTRRGSQQRPFSTVSMFLAFTAGILSFAVFFADTFMGTESAVAVLYGLIILIAAEALPRPGVVLAAVLCVILTLTSFIATHFSEHDIEDLVRLSVSLATIIMTAAVVIRSHTAKHRLVKTNIALQHRESKFRAMFEQSQVPLWQQDFSELKALLDDLKAAGIKDLRSVMENDASFLPRCGDLIRTVNVNEATLQMLGRKLAQEVTGAIQRFLHPDDSFLLELVQALFNGESRVEGSGRLLRSDGEAISVLIVLSFPDGDAAFDEIVVGMFDTTQRDQANQALLVAQAEMARASRIATVGALSASIAHELNQPIGALLLNAQSCVRWMRKDPPNVASALEAAERIIRDTRRASDILKATRQMVVSKPAKSEAVNLSELMAETCSLLEHELVSEAVVLHTRIPAHLPQVKFPRAELQQVLLNLITNGIQSVSAIPREKRRMSVEIELCQSWVQILVRDAGPGIKDEHLSRLFDPFFTTKPLGMGMGLSICRSIMEAHGGKLVGANQEAGGAIFVATLPAVASGSVAGENSMGPTSDPAKPLYSSV